MCNTIYLSTTSEQNLAELNSKHCQFEKFAFDQDREIVELLAYPARWFLSVHGGCSCHFRHYISRDHPPLFDEPQEWAEEDADEVESTRWAYDHFKSIVEAGYQLDIVDVWSDTAAEDVLTIEISLSEVGRESFRFIEAGRLVVSR